MTRISEQEFARLVRSLAADAEVIYRHNPLGTKQETLLWMLLNVLAMYLSLTDAETPCFTATPTAEIYSESIKYVVRRHAVEPFEIDLYLDELLSK